MHPSVAQWMDRIALRNACRSVRDVPGWMEHAEAARDVLKRNDFFCNFVDQPKDLTFTSDTAFRFHSPLPSDWPANNIVHGKLYRVGRHWESAPTAVLLHGWNSELAYRSLFPWLGWRLTRRGINAAMLELPFHGTRKPQPSRLNFLSGDLLRLLNATRQSIADIRALIAWLAHHTSGPVGVCGFSLGAWLSGFIACYEARARFAVLATPVAEMERAIRELPFTEPIRRSCEQINFWPKDLNLAEHEPLPPPEQILLIESIYDLFAPTETIEAVWESWKRPVIWREPQSHISILMSVPLLERMVDWIAQVVSLPRFHTQLPQNRTTQRESPHN